MRSHRTLASAGIKRAQSSLLSACARSLELLSFNLRTPSTPQRLACPHFDCLCSALFDLQVGKLFEKIGELVDDPDVLVFVLIDEVESLSAARRSTGSEPSDAIRVVNALLTQLDNLKSKPNVMVLTTSNITGAIDVAFVDRADIKAYVGPPGLLARYGILRSCVLELLQKGARSSCTCDDTARRRSALPLLRAHSACLRLLPCRVGGWRPPASEEP